MNEVKICPLSICGDSLMKCRGKEYAWWVEIYDWRYREGKRKRVKVFEGCAVKLIAENMESLVTHGIFIEDITKEEGG